ncbi:MAG TPA: tetratricopeptide repeat protein [Saprospiraceae bacterium]|nr:tetratricopeptide repeat protein [Saprospiraceae bacterium]
MMQYRNTETHSLLYLNPWFVGKSVLYIIFLSVIGACSPKPVEVQQQKPEEQQIADKKPENPCTQLDDLRGYIREQVETAFVLYRDQIRLGDFEKAYPLWKQAYYGAPGSNGRVTYHYDDGISIYKYFFDQTDDSLQKKLYIDTIQKIYNKRSECFGGDEYLAGRLGFDYYYFFSDFVDEDEVFSLFLKNVDAKKEKMDYFVINPFTKLLYDRIVAGQISIEKGQYYTGLIFNAVKLGLEECEKDCEGWEIINEYAPVRLEALEAIDGFYDCEYYSGKYYTLFEENPEDCEIIDLAYGRLLRGGCLMDDIRVVTLKEAKETTCYTPPPPPGPLKLAFDAYNGGRYREAIRYFNEFVENTDDDERKARYLLLIAKIYYRDIKDFPTSRTYALRAASLKSNWGEPYMLIGKLYASSGPLCGTGRGWNSQVVTWPAIDKFEYARSIDPSVAGEANALIRQYSQYMPGSEDVFQRLLRVGDTFRVECWIQENTVIRTTN